MKYHKIRRNEMFSSLGHHTFTIFLRLSYSEAITLKRAFESYGQVRVRPTKDKSTDGYPKGYIAEYLSGNKGITWHIRFNRELARRLNSSTDPTSPNFMQEPKTCSVRATINPKVFVGIRDYLTIANAHYLERVEAQFNMETVKISIILGKFEDYFLNRTDYCFNFITHELDLPCTAKQLLTLMRRGDIPRHFTEQVEYDKKAKRKKSFKNNLRLHCKSMTINAYCKYEQLLDRFFDCPNIENALDLLRFEVQCRYPKVYTMSKIMKEAMRLELSDDDLMHDLLYGNLLNPTKNLLSDEFAADIIQKYFYKVVRRGDYFTLDRARWMVQAHNFRQEKEERMIFTLEHINKCRGISKAREKLLGVDAGDFRRSLKDLDSIFVNPVTIPRECGIEHIPNPLRAYYNSIFDEQLISKSEHLFEELLARCLSD